MAASTPSFFRIKFFKPLVMVCKCLNLMGKVDALPFVPLLCDLFTCSNASQALDVEGGKILNDDKLIYLGEGECCISFVCCAQVCLDLFPQFRPSSDFNIILCSCHWAVFPCIKKEVDTIFLII